MITETIIEITNQINLLDQQYYTMLITLSIYLVIGFIMAIAGIILLTSFSEHLKILGLTLLILTIPLVIMSYTDNIELGKIITWKSNLIDTRDQLIKSNIKSMNCDELRLDILTLMENKTLVKYIEKHMQFENDYYYHRCEIPLRDEVMKLQREK